MSEHSENNILIAKNTAFLYVRMLLIMFVTLFTSRVVLKALGVVDFGLNSVIAGVVMLFTFVNSSMAVSTSRFLTFSIGKNLRDEISNVFSSAIQIHFIFGIGVVLVGEILGLYLVNNVLSIPENRLFACNMVFHFVILQTFITIIQVPFNSLIIAYEKMDVYAYIGVAEAVLKLSVAFIIYKTYIDRFILLCLLNLVVSLLLLVFCSAYCHKVFDGIHYSSKIRKKTLKSMLGFSFWSIFGSFAALLKDQGVNLLINIFWGPVVNAANAIALQVGKAVMSFTSNFTVALNPQIIKSYSVGDNNRVKTLLFYGGKMSFALLMLISIPLSICCEDILQLWLGQVPKYAVILTRYLLLVALVDSFMYTLGAAIQATGNIRNYQVVVSFIQILSFPVIYCAYSIGLSPVYAYVIILILCVIAIFARLYYIRESYNIYIRQYTFNVIVPCAVSFICAYIMPYLLYIMFPPTVINILCVIVVSFIISSSLFLYLGFNQRERELLINNIPLKFHFRQIQKTLFYLSVALSLIIASLYGFKALSSPKEQIKKTIHFSFDDVYLCLDDLTKNEEVYNSAFDNPFLYNLKRLHNLYGCSFTLYLYDIVDDYSIKKVTSKFKNDFSNNSDWLKFAFHSYDPKDLNDNYMRMYKGYQDVNENVLRFAGNKSLSKTIRLHRYASPSEFLSMISDDNVTMLTADDDRGSYKLPPPT